MLLYQTCESKELRRNWDNMMLWVETTLYQTYRNKEVKRKPDHMILRDSMILSLDILSDSLIQRSQVSILLLPSPRKGESMYNFKDFFLSKLNFTIITKSRLVTCLLAFDFFHFLNCVVSSIHSSTGDSN